MSHDGSMARCCYIYGGHHGSHQQKPPIDPHRPRWPGAKAAKTCPMKRTWMRLIPLIYILNIYIYIIYIYCIILYYICVCTIYICITYIYIYYTYVLYIYIYIYCVCCFIIFIHHPSMSSLMTDISLASNGSGRFGEACRSFSNICAAWMAKNQREMWKIW